ncbi:MAG: glycosyltransferase family 2 protein [Lachnospiraceae bacterium]|nr:glycosyltransferase family 2 protein [Lachnospiraceae bacterium]
MLVSIVIPCYNSEYTIRQLVELCMKEFNKMDDYECEMILVNDYSSDSTFTMIKKMTEKYPNVIGVNLSKNFGQHAAIMAGLQYISGDLVIGMDDDMQNHPSQLWQFLEKEKEGYDVVFGIFKKRKFSAFKNLTGAISRFLLWHLLERPKKIQMSSFWLAKRYVIDRVKEYEGCSVFIQLLFFRTTHNMANIDIEHYEREAGQSHYRFKKSLKLFMSFMNYSVTPLRLATFFGMFFSIIGFMAALVVLTHKFINPAVAIGWSSLVCILLILFGIVFLMLGIMGEYVGKLILTSSKTPQYVIRETLKGNDSEKKGKNDARF